MNIISLSRPTVTLSTKLPRKFRYYIFSLVVIIVISTCQNADISSINFINQPVFIIYASAPKSSQITGKRLRFPDAFISVSADIIYEFVDAFQSFFIFCFPLKIILPAIVCK